MKLRETIGHACNPTRPRKSAAHLLLLPLAFGIAGACCYLMVLAAVHLAAVIRHDVGGFAGYTEPTKTLIVLPLMLASFPLGLLATNSVAWLIPPMRRYFVRESKGRPNGDLRSSMKGLLLFTKYVSTTLVIVGFGAALLGK